MKETYIKPSIIIIKLSLKDVILTSDEFETPIDEEGF